MFGNDFAYSLVIIILHAIEFPLQLSFRQLLLCEWRLFLCRALLDFVDFLDQ